MKRFALAGNPNCGKTTLFNSLTGSTAHVGNWAGVTVDKKEGTYKKCAEPISIVDLPGIYSLSPYTPEEVIARNYILDEKPDCVINIVDATNMERNLYLTTQIMEIDVPMVVAMNMMDAVEKAGDKIDIAELERKLGVPVIKISALRETGLDELMTRAYEVSKQPRHGFCVIDNKEIAHLIGDVKIALGGQNVDNPMFHAVKLVENDPIEVEMHKETVAMINEFKETHTDEVFGVDFEALIADGRYSYITKHFASVVTRKNKDPFRMSPSDKADRILTHKVWGIPIFLCILFLLFHCTFGEDFLYLGKIFGMPSAAECGLVTETDGATTYPNFGAELLCCLYDGGIASPGVLINNLWNNIVIKYTFGSLSDVVAVSGMAEWAIGLVNDGIIEGVQAVLSFLPPIMVLFLFFSILEDSGYMARIAFILDKIFRKFGLSGRAFLPMIMGFGCSVPAMINTRTLSDEKEKIATVRVIPFFSCGAKLPILTGIAGGIVGYFGVGNADLITYGMYVLGVTTAILTVLLMRNTTLKGEIPPFIMELPNYHAPQFKNLMLHLWDKCKHFLKKAFTVILASTVVVWVVCHFDVSWHFLSSDRINESIIASLCKIIQPLLTPLGFGSQLNENGWVFIVAAVTGLVAKENVIATFATLSACLGVAGIDPIIGMIGATGIGVPGLVAFIAFNMTTIPCFATVGTARGELQDGKRFKGTILFWLISSYTVATVIYTVGTWWWTSLLWLAAAALVTVGVVLYNKYGEKIFTKKRVKK